MIDYVLAKEEQITKIKWQIKLLGKSTKKNLFIIGQVAI